LRFQHGSREGVNAVMNLTKEQKDLLRSIVSVYESGDTSQFIVVRTMEKSSLLYQGWHAPVDISADDADFEQLAREGLLYRTRSLGQFF